MAEYQYITLREKPELMNPAAEWFHSKWGVPTEAYLECMEAYLKKETELGWFLCMDGDRFVGGLGVIENDFHKSKELRPNVCALFVEPVYRKQGLARLLLDHACEKLAEHGITTAYLCTNHTDFYERCGWSFYGMVEEDGGDFCRMYQKEF